MHTALAVDILFYRSSITAACGDRHGNSNCHTKQQRPQQKLGFMLYGISGRCAVPLAVEDAVAVVYALLLLLSLSNCCGIVMYTYADCSSPQVVNRTGTVLWLVGTSSHPI